MAIVELVVRVGSWTRSPREVPMHLPEHLMTQIETSADCWVFARAIFYSLPLETLFFIEAVRVQVGDAIGVFPVYDLVRELSGEKTLIYGVHMPAFWRALALTVARHSA
jgi:hypothetical protein